VSSVELHVMPFIPRLGCGRCLSSNPGPQGAPPPTPKKGKEDIQNTIFYDDNDKLNNILNLSTKEEEYADGDQWGGVNKGPYVCA